MFQNVFNFAEKLSYRDLVLLLTRVLCALICPLNLTFFPVSVPSGIKEKPGWTSGIMAEFLEFIVL